MRARYREVNTVYKRRYAIRIALLHPSTYQASLTSLGYQILYYMLNALPGVFAERVVNDSSPPRSIETGSPLANFDVILVSAAFELDYPVVYSLLASSGINPRRERREQEDPLIIVGGPSPTANPQPLYHIADAVFRGEGEKLVEPLVEALASSSSKKKALEALASAEGVWIPDLKEDARIVVVEDLDSSFHPIRQIQSLDVEPVWGKSLLLEPSRGCDKRCFFCLEGAISKPRRERSLSTLKRIIDEGVSVNCVNKVAIYALRPFGSPQGQKLLEYIIERGLEASIPSVLLEDLDEHLIELMKKAGQKTVTIAPETPVRALQNRIGKTYAREKLLEIARAVRKHKLSLKLYYMIGLPGESIEDVKAIVEEVKEVRNIVGDFQKIKVSITPFIPKPLTVLSRAQMDSPTSLKLKTRMLKRQLSEVVGRVDVYRISDALVQYRINKMGKSAIYLIEELARLGGTSWHLLVEQRIRKETSGGLEELG
uniref:Radical SAM protein n=1 Tax=Fervidicoccus fontis TaxID=683846 RepID=A0A7J3ZJE0_9CREN